MSTSPKPPNGKPRTSSETNRNEEGLFIHAVAFSGCYGSVGFNRPWVAGKGDRQEWQVYSQVQFIHMHLSNSNLLSYSVHDYTNPYCTVHSNQRIIPMDYSCVEDFTKSSYSHIYNSIYCLRYSRKGAEKMIMAGTCTYVIFCQCCTGHNIVHLTLAVPATLSHYCL